MTHAPALPPTVLRVYLESGRKSHLVPEVRMDAQAPALCNLRPVGKQEWRGPGGGPEQLARAQDLKLCRNCQRMLTPWLPWMQRPRG